MKFNPGPGASDGEYVDKDEPPDPDQLDELDPPPIDRYCDVVLTGGVTDGVIYPWAMVELARAYRFKNIGGTSVGAMAAALTAAAEYRRRRGSVGGFNEVLLKLPRMLGEDTNGSTKLFSLFQPAKSTQRLFRLFVPLFKTHSGEIEKSAFRKHVLPALRTGKKSRILRFVLSVLRTTKKCRICKFLLEDLFAPIKCLPCALVSTFLRAYRAPASLGVLLGLLVGIQVWWRWHDGSLWDLAFALLVSTVPCAVLAVLVLVGIALYFDLAHGLVNNGFGLCTGYRGETTPAGQQSLVEWLHEGIQGAAGKPLDQPVTFQDLWNAPGGPQANSTSRAGRTRKSRSIDLRMVTTNLTHGRPYRLPLADQTSRLFFSADELGRYFPETVIKYLVDHSLPYICKVPGADPDPRNVRAGMRELPTAQLPIVVAARLSLSFPVLFSAVPLWAIDYESPPENRMLRRCWFSDGGICSNFPIHMFDSAIPGWPTFGISLTPRSIFRRTQRVWLANFHLEGRGDSWDRFGDERLPLTGVTQSPLSRLLGFAHSIIWTAKDWNDTTSMRMPGVRDRVVHVAFAKGEGGLNLELTGAQILKLARDYGQPAGRALVGKFIDPAPGNPPSRGWNEHRWVRFNTLLVALRERIEAVGAAAELAPYAIPLMAQIEAARRKPPLEEKNTDGVTLTAEQARDLRQLFAALKDLEARLAQAATPQPYNPLPTPSMHIRPPL